MGTGASGSPQPVIAIHLQSGDWLSLYDSYLAIGMQSIWLHDVIGSGVGTAPLATPPGSATSIILGTRNGYRYVLTPTAPDQATAFLDALYRLRPDLRPPTPPAPQPQPQSETPQPIDLQPLTQNVRDGAQAGLHAARFVADGAVSGFRTGVRASQPLLRNALASAKAGTAKLRASLPSVQIQVTPPGTTPSQLLTTPATPITPPPAPGQQAATPTNGPLPQATPNPTLVTPIPVAQPTTPAPTVTAAAPVTAAPVLPALVAPVAPVTSTAPAAPMPPAIPAPAAPSPLATTSRKVGAWFKSLHAPRINYSNLLAGFTHLGGLLLPMVLPLILWQTLQQRMPFTARHAKQAFFFQLIIFLLVALTLAVTAALGFGGGAVAAVITIVSDLVGFFTSAHAGDTASVVLTILGFILLVLINLMTLITLPIALLYTILAAIKGFQGKPYHYPLLGRLWR